MTKTTIPATLEQLIDVEFPQDKNIYYLNHAAVSPWPLRTKQALCEFADENVIFGATHYPNWMTVDRQLRERLATLINANTHRDIALSKSTSEALSIIAYGINWSEGDQVIITNHEFPSNRIVWESLSGQGVELIVVNIDDIDPVDAIKAAINTRTRLLSVSSVQYASGLKMDTEQLGTLCNQHSILYCIDAIQSLGAQPFNIDANKADFVVADGHKWMLGPEGLALLYINPKIRNTLKLYQYGWHMVKDRGNYDTTEWSPAEDATRFECGSPNTLGCIALNASLSLIQDIGMDTVSDRLSDNLNYLITLLRPIPKLTILSPIEPDKQAGIVTFEVTGINSTEMYKYLMKNGVICANRGGGVRLSPHFYTKKTVMTSAVEIIKEYIKENA